MNGLRRLARTTQFLFVTIFEPPATIVASTFLGGQLYDVLEAGARSPDGSFVVAGYTNDESFPVTDSALDPTYGPNIDTSASDLFIAKLSSDLRTLEYSTYFGGEDVEHVYQVWVPEPSTIWIAGGTQSDEFPTTPDALRQRINWYGWDGFISSIGIDPSNSPPPFILDNFSLSAFPNPFNSSTTLSFTLPRATQTELTIHNILGQQIEHIDFGTLEAGHHTQQIAHPTWSTGLYFATLKAPSYSKTTKLLLLR